MTVDKRSRLFMYQRLESVIGVEVATKHDLGQLEVRIDPRFDLKLEVLEQRMTSSMERSLRQILVAFTTVQIALVGTIGTFFVVGG